VTPLWNLACPCSPSTCATSGSSQDYSFTAHEVLEKEALQQHVADLKAQLAQLREDNGHLKKIDIMAAH